jgi:hypothetical protein
MRRIQITGSRLALPRLFPNGVELAPENAPSVHLAAVNFDLGAAVIKRNESQTTTEIALALMLTGKDNTFACLFLDVTSAKALAESLLEVTSNSSLRA